MILPRQFPSETFIADLSKSAATVKAVTNAAMGANVLLTLFMSVSLKSMWNMVHVLQIIVFLPLVLEYPPNAKLMIDSLEEAASLEQTT